MKILLNALLNRCSNVAFFSLFICNAANAVLSSDIIEDQLRYLHNEVAYVKDSSDIDINKAETAISDISLFLEFLHDKKEFSSVFKNVRKIRAVSLYKINQKRTWDKEPIDIAQAELAQKDFLFSIDNSVNNSNLRYLAGHNAIHVLQDAPLAYQYWEACAYQNHAGCMNTLAAHYYNGQNGLKVSLPLSVKWHKKVVNTGVRYNCAGIFSAHSLMKMSYHFPNLDTSRTWRDWQEQRNRLLEKLKIEKNYKNESYCALDEMLMMDFVLHKGEGVSNENLLDTAIDITENEYVIEVAKLFKSNNEADQSINIIEQLEHDEEKCSISLIATLYAKYNEQLSSFNKLNDFLTKLDSQTCSSTLAFKHHMQTQGAWD